MANRRDVSARPKLGMFGQTIMGHAPFLPGN